MGEIRKIRHALGYSVNQMAELLGFSDPRGKGGDRLRETESGAREITGVMFKLLRYISQAVEISNAHEHDIFMQILPRWLDCDDLEGDGAEVVMHTRFPRAFFILMNDAEIGGSYRKRLIDDGILLLPPSAPAKLLLPETLFFLLDDPVEYPSRLIEEFWALKLKQAEDDLS